MEGTRQRYRQTVVSEVGADEPRRRNGKDRGGRFVAGYRIRYHTEGVILGTHVYEYRCGECDKIMARGAFSGHLQITCRTCKATRVYIEE